ncbi:uncharacterized protein LOC106080429 isoform X1 [Stomoxys calcitrans]|uniref:Uncharacterized protein n=1 Tax=Stomoxys calcitrans TaxID=35570 RepID=A0A1I8NVV2_STOCA|nr:uncharacterized protein LOC106080429 isoform X1 [Stomoxys calcitrans]
MPLLEDSGIESEDKSSLITEEAEMETNLRLTHDNTIDHMADLEVSFRGATDIQSTSYKARDSSPTQHSGSDVEDTLKPPNTCRILQRKLELKVERAKRNYSHYQEESKRKSQSATLIPINRLPIPGDVENKPLVDYKSESDECEEISFFPSHMHKNRMKKQAELTDTFSIQEMTIDSDLESNDSQNLELLTPHLKRSFMDYVRTCFCLQPSS